MDTIVFINPLASKLHMGITGIAHIRGYLKKHSIPSEILNVNDLILNDPVLSRPIKAYCDDVARFINYAGRENTFYYHCEKILSRLLELDSRHIWDTVVRSKTVFALLKVAYEDLKHKKMVGFSLTCHSQLFFTLLSAYYIKTYINDDVEIIIGGSYVIYSTFGFQNQIVL